MTQTIDAVSHRACLNRFKHFFALPEADKLPYRIPGIAGARGYTPFGVETAKGATHHDLKEFWQIGRELPPAHRYRSSMPDNVWIPGDAGFRRAALDLWEAFDAMGRKLLEAIAVHLGLPTLLGCITPDRPNRYPEPILADDYLRERLREIKLLC